MHRACLEDGHMYWLSSTSTALLAAASREKGFGKNDAAVASSRNYVKGRDSFFNPKEFIRISCIVAKCWKIAFHLQVDQTH